MPDRGPGQVFRGAGWRALLQGCLHLRYPRSPWGFPSGGTDLSRREFPIRKIAAERVSRLKAYSHTQQAALTDVLLTAFFRALTAVLNPPSGMRLPVQSTVDLRRYLPEGRTEALCDLAGVSYPAILHYPKASFAETLRDVGKANAKARAQHPWLGTALFLGVCNLFPSGLQNYLSRRVIRRELSQGRAHPFFANLGVVDPSIFDFGDAAASDLGLFGPLTYPPNFLITTYTFRETLSITSGYCSSAVDPRLVDRFFDTFMSELPA